MATTSLAGHFLIAMPAMEDVHFRETVTYLCEHTPEGALGVVVNRPTPLRIERLFGQLDIEVRDPSILDKPVYFGGPVGGQHGFVLHRTGGQWKSSLRVNDELSLTTSRDILEAAARGEGPRDWILTLGYAGWAPGQLEAELAANAWLTVPADAELLFRTEPERLFDAALARLGVSRLTLSSFAGHA
ncbi:MAG: YqgE/AlgH family protein [Casimicrobiaceae bacterium]|nr:YqgE/AlgH family protein [Casimicrobiaceae bacterium]MCX8099065.1 YqgE/AlgH family protein [Casimicrobiaceae bacterium]MDW8312570.1 YqgE/AlgH family protein [Burkholderiales bacterium]